MITDLLCRMYYAPKYNLSFEFGIPDAECREAEYHAMDSASAKFMPLQQRSGFWEGEKSRTDVSRRRVFPKDIFEEYGNWGDFKASKEMSPFNKDTYCYVKYLMFYGAWKERFGDIHEFDAIQYLREILNSDHPSNPYTLVSTSYVPFLYMPWRKNPDKPPLRTGATQCIWNIRPIPEGKKLNWYVSWRASRIPYLAGNIFGLLDMFDAITNSINKKYELGRFYGHIVTKDNLVSKETMNNMLQHAAEELRNERNSETDKELPRVQSL